MNFYILKGPNGNDPNSFSVPTSPFRFHIQADTQLPTENEKRPRNLNLISPFPYTNGHLSSPESTKRIWDRTLHFPLCSGQSTYYHSIPLGSFYHPSPLNDWSCRALARPSHKMNSTLNQHLQNEYINSLQICFNSKEHQNNMTDPTHSIYENRNITIIIIHRLNMVSHA